MRALLGLAFLCLAMPASPQYNWADAGMPGQTVGSLRLSVDPVLGLVATGLITETNNYYAQIIPYYRDGAWGILRGFRGNVQDATRFGDTLLVCGTLSAVIEEDGDSIPVSRIAALYDGGWHPYGAFDPNGSVRRLKVLDGELYAIGSFRYADGQECNGVAKRVGGQWVPVGQLQVIPPTSTPILTDAIKYQGDLYVCGVINLAPNGDNGIARYDGQNWSAPGGGILGGVSGGRAMAIYQDELYVGGSIYLSAGNVGHMIQKWNGSAWSPVGGHLRDWNNSTSGAARCYGLLEHDGRLLAAGGFQFAGGVPAQTFAIWDGARWCGTGDAINNESHSIALYNDTIYLASGRVVNGDSTNTVVKWVSGPLQGSVCSEPVGVEELNADDSFSLFPNPASAHVMLHQRSSNQARFEVLDAFGREVSRGAVRSNETIVLEVQDWAPGLYHVRWSIAERPVAASRFVKD